MSTRKSFDEIIGSARQVLKTDWHRSDRVVVPESTDIGLGNDAGCFEGTVLYVDMRGSSELVHGYKDYFAAEMFKVFLMAACDVIKNNSGVITSFDGDRVMAIFIGSAKCSNATKSALQIHAIIRKINEEIKIKYPASDYQIDYAAGIDVSKLFVVKTGIRGENDLAWIGDAANLAAKLSEIRDLQGKTFITERVYERMNDDSKYSTASKDVCMWTLSEKKLFDQRIYGSTWWWNFQ